jgi:hypothetical protein
MGALAPDDEQSFQAFMGFDPNVRAWRNGFAAKYGEPPQMNDPSFDYRAAYMAGNRPQTYEHDTVPHWDSRGKAPDHPTAWMNDFMQRFGFDPNDPPAGGMTPEQQQFVRDAMQPQLMQQQIRGLF